MSAESYFSPAVADKARRVPAEDIRPHPTDSSVWFVRSSRTKAEHRVQFIGEWITCTCQHGDVKVSASHCYHAAAADLAARAAEDNEEIEEES